ncbi:hypothetical protein BS50DRAFT_581453 [Corynespora cassiicola Philippines]|uniref:Uncharacterized protein n=1 Tax=Corynespora cassiicola Philippines TaxID=1448308 RepID=A0A2T2PAG9_CORCC|nr:hypothetical protein BS50DRAFT_581453 [Corynespora cassiicola Philippines]
MSCSELPNSELPMQLDKQLHSLYYYNTRTVTMENYFQSIADSRYRRTRNTRNQHVLLNRQIRSCESEIQSLKNSLGSYKAHHESLKARRREQEEALKTSCFEISNYSSRALCLAIHRRLPPELRIIIYEEYWRLSATETTKVNCIEPITGPPPLPIPDPISAIWTFDRWQQAHMIPTKLLDRAASEEIVEAMYHTLNFAFNGSPRELEVALSCDTFGWGIIPKHHIKSISVFINGNFDSKRDFIGLTETSVRRTTNILLSMNCIRKLKVEIIFAARVSRGWGGYDWLF